MTDKSLTKATKAELVEDKARAANPVGAYLAGLSEGSRRGQMTGLRAAVAAATERSTAEVTEDEAMAWPWWELNAAHVAAIRAALQDRHKPAYANKALAAVRGVLKSCWRLELMSRDDYARAVDIKPVRGSSLPAGRDLSAGEVKALMMTCCADPSPAGVRDAALIGLGVSCGPRIAEACGLELNDYDPESGKMVIKGKGNKERTAWPQNGALLALADWLELRGDESGPLFCPVLYGEIRAGAGLSTTALRKMLARRAEQAGVQPFTWHDMRRTTAGDLLDAGADLVTVQKILGHSNPSTTARYDRRPEGVKASAIAKLHIPYNREKAKGEGEQ